ncbi:MAG: hypothetical protein HY540_05035, partial [Deltaproteobacteria bacterium]|nr:hypothetical protein [Deltaproteobacteria bacterium]
MARGAFIQVWHEDRDLIAVEKPAGVYAEAPPSTKVKTIVDDVHAYLRRKYRLARASF